MKRYLIETPLLNYSDVNIQTLIKNRNWNVLDSKNKILSVYNFVRDEVHFGYNIDDAISASDILIDGYGQCNTKGILFMALLRALDIPCRMHGFTIYKELQKGAMKSFYYTFAPKEIVHSWVEIYYKDEWLNLEGFILDKKYLTQLQLKFSSVKGSFCGYGVATTDFQQPSIEWNENNTYIQKEGINQDFGIFNSPDEFFKEHNQKLSPFQKFIYQKFVRHLMNINISKIRN